MEVLLKTKDVSESLGVNPTTVQRWTKFFGIACDVNDQGHFLYTKSDVEQLASIHEQLQAGKRMKEIRIEGGAVEGEEPKESISRSLSVPTKQYEARLAQLFTHVDELEEKLEAKADDVVSYQLLKHRSELDEMAGLLSRLESRMERIEEKMNEQKVGRESARVHGGAKVKRGPWKAIAQMLSV
ncbi:chromosome-anchoring protein RacA [Shouchella shacheensis]|uniref:chromosome-anchoring protein RacA n=1 Tax=Shouchella shacheensis TaxID=1649580 RepID=UPI00074023DE|nr:chromosome-anchoring protein RacA [Shouchella shacheensis]